MSEERPAGYSSLLAYIGNLLAEERKRRFSRSTLSWWKPTGISAGVSWSTSKWEKRKPITEAGS